MSTDLYRSPGFLVRRTHQIASGVFEAECGALGLAHAQHGALVVATMRRHLDQGALARALASTATTGAILRGLERRGLIRRAASRTDARKRSIELTAAGRDMLRQRGPALGARAEARARRAADGRARAPARVPRGALRRVHEQARAPLAKIR